MEEELPAKKTKTGEGSYDARSDPVCKPRTRGSARLFQVSECVICQSEKRKPENRRELEPLSR